ncbi:hypothetical protein OROGR_013970 [Orobanche gracilis]
MAKSNHKTVKRRKEVPTHNKEDVGRPSKDEVKSHESGHAEITATKAMKINGKKDDDIGSENPDKILPTAANKILKLEPRVVCLCCSKIMVKGRDDIFGLNLGFFAFRIASLPVLRKNQPTSPFFIDLGEEELFVLGRSSCFFTRLLLGRFEMKKISGRKKRYGPKNGDM